MDGDDRQDRLVHMVIQDNFRWPHLCILRVQVQVREISKLIDLQSQIASESASTVISTASLWSLFLQSGRSKTTHQYVGTIVRTTNLSQVRSVIQ
jgi:hypothetical protein